MKRRDVWFLRQWCGGAQRVERFRGVRDELGKILSAQGKGTWVMRVGDQTSGSAHHLLLPHPSQGSQYLPGGGPAAPAPCRGRTQAWLEPSGARSAGSPACVPAL